MIILDIDDTLINHSGAEMVAAQKFGMKLKKTIPQYNEATFNSKWHEITEYNIQTFLKGEISFQEQRRRRIRSVFNDQNITNEQADDIFNIYLKFYEDSWTLFPDVIPFLQSFKNHGYGILSDGSQNQQEMKLEKTGIRAFFKFVVTAEQMKMSKPDPMFFMKACELGNTTPSETFYIGDNIKKDALGAFNAGLNGVWLNRSKKDSEIETYSILSLKDFEPNRILKWMRNKRKA